MALISKKKINVKTLTVGLFAISILCVAGIAHDLNRIRQIHAFNEAVTTAKSPKSDVDSFEAKFSTAYWLAKNERYKESTLLFTHLMDNANVTQKSAIHHNLGNIFFLRGLAINGTNMKVRSETEYLLTQAKTAYIQSLKLENTHWDSRHNLDRVLTMLPATPTPGVGESDSPGLIMGNIPVGLP